MMKFYLDITLLPNVEANLGFLWQKVYQQLHLALVATKTTEGNSNFAVSFPRYNDKVFPFGDKLRLFGPTHDQLQELDIGKWLSRLTDYNHCTSIKEVPESVNRFSRFKRVQFDTNVERMARRRMKRKNETLEQALAHYKGFAQHQSDLPFVMMNSLSRGEKFMLFIERELLDEPKEGQFSCYGLSATATVPWF